MEPPHEVVTYYERFTEESRLSSGPSRLEFERTKDILARTLPKPPVRIIDVGGAAGAHSTWLAELGTRSISLTRRLASSKRHVDVTRLFPGPSRRSRLPTPGRFLSQVVSRKPC